MSDKKITLDSIVKGKQERPVRQVIYGRDGIGKTHYMCGAEDIIVMAFEDGQNEFDVQKIQLFQKDISFDDAIETLKLIYSNYKKLGIKTVGVDSLDWLEAKSMHTFVRQIMLIPLSRLDLQRDM